MTIWGSVSGFKDTLRPGFNLGNFGFLDEPFCHLTHSTLFVFNVQKCSLSENKTNLNRAKTQLTCNNFFCWQLSRELMFIYKCFNSTAMIISALAQFFHVISCVFILQRRCHVITSTVLHRCLCRAKRQKVSSHWYLCCGSWRL